MGGEREVIILAHRGASGYAPENTFAAFDRALHMQADGIETDVRVTADRALVLVHDERVDRTTNGHGRVADLSLAQIKALDAGSWFGPEFVGQQVPTLAEFLDAYGSRTLLCLEIKAPEAADATLAQVRERGLLTSVQFTSFHFEVTVAIRAQSPEAIVGFLTRRFDPAEIARVVDAGLNQICPHASTTTPELVQEAHRQGLVVRAWGVGDRAAMRQAIGAGVDGMTINWPDWPRQEAPAIR